MKNYFFTLCAACMVATFAQTTVAQTDASQTSVDVRVAQGLDDAEEFSGETSQGPAGTVYLDSSDLELFEDAGTLQVVGLRFENVTVPQGATVTSAYLQFSVDETTDKATSVDIQGEASDSAALFAEMLNSISSRPRTVAAVTWTPAPWTKVDDAGTDQQSPDLSEIVQEIVNRPGWQSGNALAFILSGTGHRVARSFDGKAKEAPLLHIDYATAAGATPPADSTPAEATPAATAPAEPTPADTATTGTVTTPAPQATAPTTPEPAPAQPATAATAPAPTAQPAQPETAAANTSTPPSPRDRQARYSVSPVGDSRVSGSLFVADYGDGGLILTLFVSGQATADTLGVALLRGDCGSDGDVLLTLEPAQGSKGGLSVTTAQISFAALTNADLHANLYGSADGSGAVIACGEVGAK